MHKSVWVVILAMTAWSFAADAEIYKWKDGKNITNYTGVPPSGNVRHRVIKPSGATAADAAVPTASEAANKAASSDKPKDATALKSTDQKEIDRKGKELACANAKENLQKLNAGGSIYKENAKGERQYLDETSIKNEVAAAQKEIDATCNK